MTNTLTIHLNIMLISDTDICMTRIREMSNLKNICWIYHNFSTVPNIILKKKNTSIF